MTSSRHQRFMIRASVLSLGMSLASAALAQTPPAAGGTATRTAAADGAEDIVVTGIRRSIETSIRAKREADQIADVISSEELGKLPDQNIAEGLQRITGVQIDRVGGEGNRFQVRGLDQVLTLVNGRQIAPDANGLLSPAATREVNLFVFPSEIFTEVVVVKSPSASQIEGAIGGMVDLRMPDPLAVTPAIAAGFQIGRFDLSDKTKPNGYVLLSRRFMADRLGVLLGVSYFASHTATDLWQGGGWLRVSNIDVTGDGVPDANVRRPVNLNYNRIDNDRHRLSVNGRISFAATERLKLDLEGYYVRQEVSFQNPLVNFLLNSAVPTGTGLVTRQEPDGSTTVVAGEFSGVQILQSGLRQDETRDLYSISGSLDWDIGERTTLSADVSYAKTDVALDLAVYQVDQVGAVAAFDVRSEVPSIELRTGTAIDQVAGKLTRVVTPFSITNSPNLLQGRIDLVQRFDSGALSALRIGARLTDTFFDNVRFQTRYQDNTPIGFKPPLSNFPQYVDRFSDGDFLGGAGGVYPRRWVITTVSPDPASGRALLAAFGDTQPLQFNPTSSFQVSETTYAGYVQADYRFDVGVPVDGNVGVRLVRTEQTSSGFAVSGATATPISLDRGYTDVLPSANLRIEATPQFVIRAAAAKVMTRPNVSDLSIGTNVTFSGNPTASSGNPTLDPFRATQFDISLEYYFGRSNLISVAGFYKDVESFTIIRTTPNATLPGFPGSTFFLTRPENGKGGTVKGLELGYKQDMSFLPGLLSGLGLIANYTLVDSRQDENGLPLPNLSKHSFNLIGYYEKGPFQARVAYNWRSSRFIGIQLGSNAYLDSRGQLDASASIDLNEHVSLTIEGIDLLRSPLRGYAEYESRPNVYEVNDRRIFAGVRVRF